MNNNLVDPELFMYNPPLTKRSDFDEFWEETIEKTKGVDLNPKRILYPYPSPHVTVYSISYNGFDDTRINGWLIIPNFVKKEKLKCIIHYHGYTGSAGVPSDFMYWSMMGIAVISIDCRGQSGRTGNSMKYTSGATQSVVCMGVLNKYEYYFRAVYMDCIKAIDFACIQEEIDESGIIIEGESQGGAIGMAVCALDSRPCLAMVDVPSNSNIEERIKGVNGSFSAVTEYLQIHPDKINKVFETLSYFDTMNMADKITCKMLASAALKDDVCPARMYFATYNRINAPKEIKLYPFNGHEGGGMLHKEYKLEFLSKNIN